MGAVHEQVETTIAQSRRALEYLHPDNLPVRTATTWTLGLVYQLQGDRAAASRAFTEAISISRAIGHSIITMLATTGLGNVQEAENRLALAAQTYRRVLQLVGDPPLPAERILDWPVYSTNGTTWTPPNSTGNKASNWRGR